MPTHPSQPQHGELEFVALARRLLADSTDQDAADVLATLVAGLPVETVGALMEKLPPTRRLDYEPHPIDLVVSSTEIETRLVSVEKEPFTVEWIEQFVEPGDVFYDVGANVGAYSMVAAKASGNRARVFAFEPSPASFLDLSRNIELNGCGASVVALPVALWSRYELLSLEPGATAGGRPSRPEIAGAAEHHLSSRIEGGTPIMGIPLDDLVERFALPVPNHAKIDTDGYELEVLRGAEQTLTRAEWRSILIEFDREDTARNEHIRAALADAGFGPGREHARRTSPAFPNPDRRPDVYWTFVKAEPGRRRVPRVAAGAPSKRPPATTIGAVRRRAVAVTLAVVSLLFLLLVLLPEELGDRPYDVFGLKF